MEMTNKINEAYFDLNKFFNFYMLRIFLKC